MLRYVVMLFTLFILSGAAQAQEVTFTDPFSTSCKDYYMATVRGAIGNFVVPVPLAADADGNIANPDYDITFRDEKSAKLIRRHNLPAWILYRFENTAEVKQGIRNEDLAAGLKGFTGNFVFATRNNGCMHGGNIVQDIRNSNEITIHIVNLMRAKWVAMRAYKPLDDAERERILTLTVQENLLEINYFLAKELNIKQSGNPAEPGFFHRIFGENPQETDEPAAEAPACLEAARDFLKANTAEPLGIMPVQPQNTNNVNTTLYSYLMLTKPDGSILLDGNNRLVWAKTLEFPGIATDKDVVPTFQANARNGGTLLAYGRKGEDGEDQVTATLIFAGTSGGRPLCNIYASVKLDEADLPPAQYAYRP